jgi:hypothetical protein
MHASGGLLNGCRAVSEMSTVSLFVTYMLCSRPDYEKIVPVVWIRRILVFPQQNRRPAVYADKDAVLFGGYNVQSA